MTQIEISRTGFALSLAAVFGLGVAVAVLIDRPSWLSLSRSGDDGPHDPAVLFRAPDASMAGQGGAVGTAALAPSPTLPDVETMVAALKARLEQNPVDADGWQMLAWSYANTGRVADAVPAYARAAELKPDDPEILGQYGAALVALAGGKVEVKAAAVFDRVLNLAPGDGRGLYYAGLARLQGGDGAAGADLLRRALTASPPDAAWVPDLRAALGRLAP